MRHGIMLALALLPVTAPCHGEDTMRILTYNIHHGEGLDGEVDLDRIAGVIRTQSPDVVCLQEVDRGMKRTGKVDMPAVLAAKLGMEVVYGPNLKQGAGQYGNATLTRLPVVSSKNHRLPSPAKGEPRGCLRVTVDAGGHQVNILNTHFSLHPENRKAQAAAIVDTFKKTPIILCGDFNETAEQPALRLLQGVFNDSFRAGGRESAATYAAGKSEARRIDFVLASKEINIVSSRVVDSPQAKVASDHLPFLAAIDLGRFTDPAKEQGITDNEDERLNEALAPELVAEGRE